MTHALHVDYIERAAMAPSAPLVGLTLMMGRVVLGPPRAVQVVAEGLENLPHTPCIIATNHTHNYDFLPLRYWLHRARKQHASTWIKARAWHNSLQAFYLRRTLNVPLSSRGYVLSSDFQRTLGRRPTEEEYRALRNHLDNGVELPSTEVFERLSLTRRYILGLKFDPYNETYSEALERVFLSMMDESLKVARAHIARGAHMHINPQGTRSGRLTTGLPGVIHAAKALQLPVVPTAVLGMRKAMPNQGLRTAGGVITLRFGKPQQIQLHGVSDAYRPFGKLSEGDERIVQQELEDVMSSLNALCDADHCRQDNEQSDAKTGVERFI